MNQSALNPSNADVVGGLADPGLEPQSDIIEQLSTNSITAPKLHPAVMMSSLFINLLALGLPLVILQVYDRILPNQALETLTLLMIAMALVVVIDTTLKIARAYLVGWTAGRFQHQTSVEALKRLLNAPSHMIEKDAPSVHVDRLNAIDALREFYGGQSRLLLIDLPFIAIFLGLIAFVGGALIFVPLVLFAILGIATVLCGQALRSVLEERSQLDDRRYDFVIEALTGIETIKTMAMEPQIQRRYERLQRTAVETGYKTIILGNAAQSFGNLFANMTMVSVVSVGALMVIDGTLSMGALACCSLLSGRTIQPLLKGLGLWTQMQSLSIARGRVNELLRLPEVKDTGYAPIEHCRGAISVRNLSFSYSDDEPDTFKGINLKIPPGSIVGLRGEDGSGKSTLTRILAGQIVPTSGTVLIDGHDLHGEAGSALAEWIAYVPQAPAIFQGTILENLTMFRTGDAIDAAREAAALIGLDEDIHRLPEGYDTPLSEGVTDELPAGMMQRIAIARALARRPKILLFDEANGSLDSNGDRLVREGLEKLRGHMTIILVSLRPSLLRVADRIYKFSDGTLVPMANVQAPQVARAAKSESGGAA